MKANGAVFTIDGSINTGFEEKADPHYQDCAYDTPMRPGAFDTSNEEKIRIIASHFKEIMNALGLDVENDSLRGTPRRVATMYVKEIFSGLDPANKPKVTLFENKYRYHQVLVEKNIRVQTNCEHHFLPIIGKAHIGYIPSSKVIGLSKLNRLVKYYSQRPQVQERLTNQLANELKITLGTEDVAIVIDAIHLCVGARGVEDNGSSTITTHFSGKFNRDDIRNEFMAMIR
jgi:GTP cyclohydrolase I